MTPQEQELIMQVAKRLQDAPAQRKDPDADALIRSQVGAQPDALYLLTQTVIAQEQQLLQARQRRDRPAAGRRAQGSTTAHEGPNPATGFLGHPTAGHAAAAGSRTRSPAPPAPMADGARGAAPGRGAAGDFLRNAAMMAVGVAGGQMLFSGLQGMFSDANAAPDATGTPAADDAAENDAGGGGWGADAGVSEAALSGDDPSLWDESGPADDAGWGVDQGLADGDFDSTEFDDGFGDEDWG